MSLSKSQNISPPKASGCRAPWRYPSKGSLKFRWCQKSSRERHPRRFFSYARCKSSPAAARHPLPWTIFNVVIKLCPLVSHHAKLAHWQTKLINIVCLNHSLEAFGTFYLPLSTAGDQSWKEKGGGPARNGTHLHPAERAASFTSNLALSRLLATSTVVASCRLCVQHLFCNSSLFWGVYSFI